MTHGASYSSPVVSGMSQAYGVAARRSLRLCVFIGFLGACATARQEASPSQATPSQSGEPSTEECSGDNPKMCLELGLRYAKSQEDPLNKYRAAAMLKKACDAEVVEGCTQLGVRSLIGAGVPQDKP